MGTNTRLVREMEMPYSITERTEWCSELQIVGRDSWVAILHLCEIHVDVLPDLSGHCEQKD